MTRPDDAEDGAGKRPTEPASKASHPESEGLPVPLPLPFARSNESEPAPVLRLGPPEVVAKSGRAASPDRARQDAWVERLRARDEGALREVIEAFSERITAVVAGYVADRDAVEDVVHEAFVKAWYRIGSFKGDSGLYTWLYRVAINAAKDHGKRRRRRPALALEDIGPTGQALPSPGEPGLETLERREARRRVRVAIASLPPKFRAVIVLREIEGLRYEEIASILDISQGTVESRLFRARRRLRERLVRMGAST
jgi:RNA polymerase sigma-70 factor (ECF subfamily)